MISAGTLAGPPLADFCLKWRTGHGCSGSTCRFRPRRAGSVFAGFPVGDAAGKSPFDYVGTFLLGGGVCLLMLAAEGAKDGADALNIWLEGAFGILLLCALVVQAQKIDYGIIDRELFRHRKVWLGNTSSFIINLAQTATLIPVTFYLQSEIGFSASATGALLMLQPLVMGIVAPFAGWFRTVTAEVFRSLPERRYVPHPCYPSCSCRRFRHGALVSI